MSLPRSTLYNHYLQHCQTNKLDAVNAASFGKLIRSVFMGLRTRRLGTRLGYTCVKTQSLWHENLFCFLLLSLCLCVHHYYCGIFNLLILKLTFCKIFISCVSFSSLYNNHHFYVTGVTPSIIIMEYALSQVHH